MQRSRGIAVGDQTVDLILHERDERTDDDIETIRDQRRHLIAQALSASGRQNHERITTRQARRDRLGLERPQGVVAEVSTQQREDGLLALGIQRDHRVDSGRLLRQVRIQSRRYEHERQDSDR
jgi:hypothetical protein